MSFEEKRAWLFALVSAVSYAIYLTIVLGRADPTPLADVPYAATLLWTVGGSIVATIVLTIVLSILFPRDANRRDIRDRQINRFGEYVGQSFVIIGGVAALLLAMLKADYFWIANAVYLGFTLSAVVGSAAKIAAYRGSFQPW